MSSEANETAGAWVETRQVAASWGAPLDDAQLAQLQSYARLLGEWNQRFNLTSVTDPAEIVYKHFADALSCAQCEELRTAGRLLDVGSGAGFPGLVLKIAFPSLEVVLLDALAKRLSFVERVIAELGLSGVHTRHGRAEDEARRTDRESPREQFDIAVARAVAPLNVLVEWLLPFVRVGGCALAMKGPDPWEEAQSARGAIRYLGGADPRVLEFSLPGGAGERSLLHIRKVRPTPPGLPRLPGAARKRPLSGLAPGGKPPHT